MKNKGILFLVIFVIGAVLLPIGNCQWLQAAVEKSSAKAGYLGVVVEPLTRSQKKELKADFGVVITEIAEDSPADKFGLQEDDVIQSVNGTKIRRPSTLTRVIRKLAPGDEAKITVVRDGATKTISVTLGRAKKSRGFDFAMGAYGNALRMFAGGAYLGVELFALNKDLAGYFGVKANNGVLILQVEEDSPAEKAGIKAGDVITKIDNEEVSEPADVQEILSELEEDDEVELELIRQNNKKTIKVKVEERENLRQLYFGPQKMIKELEIIPDKDLLLKKYNLERDIRKRAPQMRIETRSKIIEETI
ncbi:MAG: PDZ domain-containing protein [candidate division KSB1 bacterium]|nr:PDZ domain-containing protein [candidate division KSB1 bacterium]